MKNAFLLIIFLSLVIQAHRVQASELSDTELINTTAIEHTINCSDSTCPDGIGTLVTLGIMGREFCRVFLIDEKTVITNAHCVEPLITDGTCENRAAIKFNNGETAYCKKIRYSDITENDISRPDIAILELTDSVKAKPLNLLRSSFHDEMELYYYKSSYSFEKNSSEMSKLDCRAKKYSSAAGTFFTNTPVTISISDCPFDYGDSGSPVFNRKGEVVALLQGGLPQEAIDFFKRLKMPEFDNISYLDVLKKYSKEENVEFKPVISATTFTCLNREEIPGEVNCQPKTIKEYYEELLYILYEDYTQKLIINLDDYKNLKIELDFESYKNILKDIKPTEIKPEDMLTLIKPQIDCSSYNGKVLLPVQKIRSSHDSYFRIQLIPEYELMELCN